MMSNKSKRDSNVRFNLYIYIYISHFAYENRVNLTAIQGEIIQA